MLDKLAPAGHPPAISSHSHATPACRARSCCTWRRPLSVLLFRLPTVNLNLKSFQAKWNNENIPSSASEPLCIMYSQERKNAAQCQDRRDSGGDNASFYSASSSSGIGFTLKTDMFDSWGAANVFAASALFKREKGKKKIIM